MFYPPNKMEWNFVPDLFLPKVKPADVVIPEDLSPILVHHYSNSTWSYNTEVNKERDQELVGFDKPEWKGRVNIKDPQNDAGPLNCFTTITQHADEMAKAYEQAFGKPIKSTPACKMRLSMDQRPLEEPTDHRRGGRRRGGPRRNGRAEEPADRLCVVVQDPQRRALWRQVDVRHETGMQPVMGCSIRR